MTPAAQTWLKDQLLPKDKRYFDDETGSFGFLEDFHFFETSHYVTEMLEFALAMSNAGLGLPSARLSFLPAPKTWIEWIDSERKERAAHALIEIDKEWARIILFCPTYRSPVYIGDLSLRDRLLKLGNDEDVIFRLPDEMGSYRQQIKATTWLLYAALALINSPRTIHRTRHGPHRGLQRKLASRSDLAGHNFNLIHETLELEVRPPQEFLRSDEATQLTGTRALHYCRAYLWQSRGIVCPGHWRGDPSRGIKVRDYSLVPAKDERFAGWTPSV